MLIRTSIEPKFFSNQRLHSFMDRESLDTGFGLTGGKLQQAAFKRVARQFESRGANFRLETPYRKMALRSFADILQQARARGRRVSQTLQDGIDHNPSKEVRSLSISSFIRTQGGRER